MNLKSINNYLFYIFLASASLIIIPYHFIIILIVTLFLLSTRYNRDFWILLSILSFTVITRTEFENLRGISVVITTLILLLLFIKQYGFKYSIYPELPKEIFFFLFLLLFTLIISVPNSSSFSLSLTAAIRLLVFFAICYLFYSFIADISIIYLYIKALLISGFIISVSIYYDFFLEGFNFFLSSGILARFTGIYDNPNFVGLITMISTFLTISLLHIEKFKSNLNKTILYGLLLNNLLIFLIIASRAAVIGSILGCTFILFFLNRKLLTKLYLISGGIILLFLSIPTVQNFLAVIIRFQDFSIRKYLWDAGYEIFKDNIFTGIGPSTFGQRFYSYIPSSIISFFKMRFDLSEKNPHPHNFFLLMASENGILGLIMSISIFILFFYMGIKVIKIEKTKKEEAYIITLAFIAVGMGTLFRSFFEVSGIMSYGYISRDIPFWLIFISLIYLYKNIKTEKVK